MDNRHASRPLRDVVQACDLGPMAKLIGITNTFMIQHISNKTMLRRHYGVI